MRSSCEVFHRLVRLPPLQAADAAQLPITERPARLTTSGDDVRQRTARKLASHFRQKCAGPDGHPDDEDLLETLVRGFRRGASFRAQ